MNFSKSVEAARNIKPMTQQEMADVLSLKQAFVSRQIKQEEVKRKAWNDYAKIFEMTVIEFISLGVE